MRTLNFHHYKFKIGTKVKMIKDYVNGNVILRIGEVGVVKSSRIENFPDLGLFDVRILHISFKNTDLYIGDRVAEEYMDIA